MDLENIRNRLKGMMKLLIAYKTEIKPTDEQKIKINKTIGTCRFIYNFYIAYNKEIYKSTGKFITGYDFSKWLNNEFILNNPEYLWIKEVPSKAVKQSIMNAEKAFKRFFKGLSKFPRFKKRRNQDVKCYFPKNNKTDCIVERHRIKIPVLGYIRIKEKGYIPNLARSLTIEQKAERYYVSVLCEITDIKPEINSSNYGLGIDLGIKDFVIISNNKTYKNINKTKKAKKLEKKLKRQQKRLSRKYEMSKKQKFKEKEKATRHNIQKQVGKVQKLHQRLTNIRTDYINKIVSEIVKTKPSYITIEDLNVSGMMKNRHLSKAIAQQKFYEFKMKLTNKCNFNKIELRIVNRFYPSSKTCSYCGNIKKDLKLSDRIYKCECGFELDRDLNAAINLENAKIYKIA
jgi:putative transposase